MLAFLKRYLARRRLWPVVMRMPHQLQSSFGASDVYTTLQVRRAITDLRLPQKVWLHALALACSPQVLDDEAHMARETYERLRAEMADLFGLPDHFTMNYLQSKRFAQHHPAPENEYSSGGH